MGKTADPRPNAGTAASRVEIAPGIIRHWLANGQILAYTVTTNQRDAVDAWVDDVIAIVRSWPLDRPFLLMHYLDEGHVAFTPYLRSRIRAFVDNAPRLNGRVALVFTYSVLAHLTQIFLRGYAHGRIIPRIFFNRTTALYWLMEQVEAAQV